MDLGCSFADMVTGTESTLKQIALETAEKMCPELLKTFTESQILSWIRKKAC